MLFNTEFNSVNRNQFIKLKLWEFIKIVPEFNTGLSLIKLSNSIAFAGETLPAFVLISWKFKYPVAEGEGWVWNGFSSPKNLIFKLEVKLDSPAEISAKGLTK